MLFHLEKDLSNLNINFKFLNSGEIVSMRHLKNEVATIKNGIECGIQLADRSIEPQAGDKVINYTTVNQKQTIDWSPGF